MNVVMFIQTWASLDGLGLTTSLIRPNELTTSS